MGLKVMVLRFLLPLFLLIPTWLWAAPLKPVYFNQNDPLLLFALELDLGVGSQLCGPISLFNWIQRERAQKGQAAITLDTAALGIQRFLTPLQRQIGLTAEQFRALAGVFGLNSQLQESNFDADSGFEPDIDFLMLKTVDNGLHPSASAMSARYHFVMVEKVDQRHQVIHLIDPELPTSGNAFQYFYNQREGVLQLVPVKATGLKFQRQGFAYPMTLVLKTFTVL